MAVPKRRTSRAKGRKRRSNQAMKRVQLVYCENCGTARPAHSICPKCDHYHGRFYTSEETS